MSITDNHYVTQGVLYSLAVKKDAKVEKEESGRKIYN
jgi:hypothetical protein